jgi:hypothetical protein
MESSSGVSGAGLNQSFSVGAKTYQQVGMIQDVELSTSNSSTTNLASAASFTGTTATTLGVAAIQVCLFADQNCTIQVQQAQEDPGVNWNIIDSWTYTANSTGNDAARTIQAMGASFRTIVTNNGGSTTTAFRLTSVQCPIADTLPRGLTQSGNLRVAVLESNVDTAAIVTLTAAGAGTTNSADQLGAGVGVKVVIDITAVGGTPTLVVSIQGKDIASGKYYTILASAALATVSTTVLTIYPAMVAAANLVANDILPRTWRVSCLVGGGTPSVTATVGASMVI